MPLELPHISIIIPTLNESEHIENCIKSLIFGSYPLSKMEILVVDGGSTDNTVETIKALSSTHQNINILNNPKKIVPAAMNIGISAAKHKLLVWCGAHAIYDQDYLKNSVLVLLEEVDCSSSGGIIQPIAKTSTGKAIKIATMSKFGIGNAHYRHAKKRQYVDTVFGGCFYKESIEKVGGFNEKWVRNQDYELNYRLRTHIGKIVLDPSIKCQYYCRETIPMLAKQYFSYGFWRCKTVLKYPSSFTFRQAIPVILVLCLALSLILIIYNPIIGWLSPMIYLGITLIMSMILAIKYKQSNLLAYLPIIFPTLHISWGVGFIKGFFNHNSNKAD